MSALESYDLFTFLYCASADWTLFFFSFLLVFCSFHLTYLFFAEFLFFLKPTVIIFKKICILVLFLVVVSQEAHSWLGEMNGSELLKLLNLLWAELILLRKHRKNIRILIQLRICYERILALIGSWRKLIENRCSHGRSWSLITSLIADLSGSASLLMRITAHHNRLFDLANIIVFLK